MASQYFKPVEVAANPSDALAEALKNRARLQTYSVVFCIETSDPQV